MNVTTETGGHPNERDWSWWLKIVGTLATAPPGIIGCLVTLLVFTRRRALRQTSFSVYLRAQCVSDALTLLQQAFYKLADLVWFLSGGEMSLLAWQDKYACQTLEMLKRTLYMITVWMTVCYCVDRYVSLRFPLSLRTQTMRRPRTALIVTAVLCTAAPLIESYYFFTTTRSSTASAEGRVCVTVTDRTLRKIHGIMDNVVLIFILTAGLPLMSIVVLNILTVRALRQQAKERTKGLNATQCSSKLATKLNKVMLYISAFYVACSLPYTVSAFAGAAYATKTKPPMLWHLIYVADFMAKLFFMSNFVIYSMMRKQFNEELRQVCSCCQLWLRPLRNNSPSSKSGSSSSGGGGSALSSVLSKTTTITSEGSAKAKLAAS